MFDETKIQSTETPLKDVEHPNRGNNLPEQSVVETGPDLEAALALQIEEIREYIDKRNIVSKDAIKHNQDFSNSDWRQVVQVRLEGVGGGSIFAGGYFRTNPT